MVEPVRRGSVRKLPYSRADLSAVQTMPAIVRVSTEIIGSSGNWPILSSRLEYVSDRENPSTDLGQGDGSSMARTMSQNGSYAQDQTKIHCTITMWLSERQFVTSTAQGAV